MHHHLTWTYLGTLDTPTNPDGAGTYLLVFRGKPKRVIYVGETGSFTRRISEHYQATMLGYKTIWRADSSEDIYELMSYREEGEPHTYYHNLARSKKLWASTAIARTVAKNDLYSSDSFEKNWQEFAHHNYVQNIEVWACPTPDKETRLQLESQLQKALKTTYAIGSHIYNGKQDMCWLGKIELEDEVFDTRFTFSNVSVISDEFTWLLQQLGPGELFPYRKQIKLQEERVAAEQLRVLRETYPRAQSKWEPYENEILGKCALHGIKLKEASEALERTEEEILAHYSKLRANNKSYPIWRYR